MLKLQATISPLEDAYTQVGILAKQILVAQIAGAFLIICPSIILGKEHVIHSAIVISVIVVTALYYSYIKYGWWRKRVGVSGSAERLQRYRALLGVLVVLDIAIILGAIGLSGGIYKSHLGFVLLLIPASVGFTRAGGHTLFAIAAIVVVVVVLDSCKLAIGTLDFIPSHWCGIAFKWFYAFVNIPLEAKDSTESPWFAVAYAFGLTIGIVLSVYQSFLASGRTIPDRVRQEVEKSIGDSISIDPTTLNELRKCVGKAYHRMSRVASLTNIPEIHCSVVHPLNDVVFQAYVLATPGLYETCECSAFSKSPMQRAAEMVFGVHWLDDAFDYLGYHSLKDKSGTALEIHAATTKLIAEFYHGYGIGRMLKKIKGESELKYIPDRIVSKPPWIEGVELGLMRVILGGFIQRGDSSQRQGAIGRFRNDTDKLIKNADLKKLFAESNVAFLWGISKTDMPLVMGMFWNPETDPDLEEKSFVMDTLFMPLLVWHDLEEEVKREHVPRSGFEQQSNMRKEIVAAGEHSVKILRHCKTHCAFQGKTWTAIKPIFKLVFQAFEGRMPRDEIHKQYRSIAGMLLEES